MVPLCPCLDVGSRLDLDLEAGFRHQVALVPRDADAVGPEVESFGDDELREDSARRV